jgi:hypothetical protein
MEGGYGTSGAYVELLSITLTGPTVLSGILAWKDPLGSFGSKPRESRADRERLSFANPSFLGLMEHMALWERQSMYIRFPDVILRRVGKV